MYCHKNTSYFGFSNMPKFLDECDRLYGTRNLYELLSIDKDASAKSSKWNRTLGDNMRRREIYKPFFLSGSNSSISCLNYALYIIYIYAACRLTVWYARACIVHRFTVVTVRFS